MANAKITERLQFVDALSVQSSASGNNTGTWQSMSGVGRVLARAKFAETTATNATLQLYQAQDANGAGAKTASDQQSATTDGTTASAPVLDVEIRAGDLDIAGGFTHVAPVVTYGSGNAVTVDLILGDLSFRPPSS